MSDRLQFFREQMAAFEGTSDPQKAIGKGYFIKQPRNSLANTIANRIALRPSSSHLLIGGIGSGKTTQLMMARDRINEIDDTHAVYVDASLYTDISEIQSGALIAIVGLVLSDMIENKESHNFFVRQSYGYTEKKEIILKDAFIASQGMFGEIIKHENIIHKGVLNKKPVNKKFKEIIEKLRKINKEIKKKIIIIIDGLDRLSDTLCFSKLIDNDLKLITESSIGIILVGSLTIAFSESRTSIENSFNHFYYQPCFDIEEDSESYDFFNKVLLSRSKINFISGPVAHLLIYNSGGVLRDLINLTQASIEETYIADSDRVEIEHVDIATNSFGKSKIFGVNDDGLKILQTTCHKDDFIPRTQEDIQLLASQLILEYQYPKKRFAVHPTIKPLLQKSIV